MRKGTFSRALCRNARRWAWVLFLLVALQAPVSAETTVWLVEDGPSTLIVEGDRTLALKTVMRVRQLEAAARWMLGGEDSFRAPRSLIFAVHPWAVVGL